MVRWFESTRAHRLLIAATFLAISFIEFTTLSQRHFNHLSGGLGLTSFKDEATTTFYYHRCSSEVRALRFEAKNMTAKA